MANIEIHVQVKYAWWFTWIYDPAFFAMSQFIVNYIDIEFEPNYDSYAKALRKAVKVKVITNQTVGF